VHTSSASGLSAGSSGVCRRQLRATTAAAAVENDLAKSLSTVERLLSARRADVMAPFPTLTRDKAINELTQ
jgi:hypothetical protein